MRCAVSRCCCRDYDQCSPGVVTARHCNLNGLKLRSSSKDWSRLVQLTVTEVPLLSVRSAQRVIRGEQATCRSVWH